MIEKWLERYSCAKPFNNSHVMVAYFLCIRPIHKLYLLLCNKPHLRNKMLSPSEIKLLGQNSLHALVLLGKINCKVGSQCFFRKLLLSKTENIGSEE